MILLREIQDRDLDALERFAQIPGFINLTADRDVLRDKIRASVQSFRTSPAPGKFDGKYLFVAEHIESNRVVGTSMIAAEHGNPESPHFYFEVASEEKYSDTINTGFIHGTLKLKYDTDGPSEIGGLVLDPQYRNTDARVGRQLSFVRFLFVGLNKTRFKRKILAELLPPLNKKGQSPLWEAVGRRFTNMDYWEADQLCQKNKEFIFSLFPSGKIYTTFLPAEARNSIGKVGKETEPVIHMLKKIGFTYKNQVDPFDGGPHLWADIDQILPIQKLRTVRLDAPASRAGGGDEQSGLLAPLVQKPGEFRAASVHTAPSDQGGLTLPLSEMEQLHTHLGISAGDSVVFMPYY